MSYDLAVFDPNIAPKDPSQFKTWFEDQMSSYTIEDYENPESLSLVLKSWFLDMRTHYPPLNPPDESHDIDDPKLSDYCFCHNLVYVNFARSQSESAYDTMFRLAQKHRIGFFNVSSSPGEVWFPLGGDDYICVFEING